MECVTELSETACPQNGCLETICPETGKKVQNLKKTCLQPNPISFVEPPFPILMYAPKNGANKDNFSNRSK